MAANTSTKSAIKEVRDQLLIDYADGSHLNVVTDNLGFHRPAFGFSGSDEWRALARALALGPRQIELAFRKILDICIGPDFNRIAVLSADAEAGSTTITVEDASQLVQVGTLVLSPGLAAEESIKYCFVDRATQQVFLEGPTTNAHAALVSGQTSLVQSVLAAATALILPDSAVLPTTGFPYSLSLGKGTSNEELVTVTANTVATNTLTVSPTSNAHSGFKVGNVRRVLEDPAAAGRVFLVFDVGDTGDFPLTGWVRIAAGTVASEIVAYDDNDIVSNILYLSTPLANSHAAGVSVELMQPGADVSTANAVQLGTGWAIYSTTPEHVKILAPSTIVDLTALDATWLHDAAPNPLGSSTLSVATAATDTVITLASVDNFPDEAGMLTIGGSQRFFYTLRDEDALTLTLSAPIGAVHLVGTTVVLYEVPYAGTDLEEGNPRDSSGVIQPDTYPGPYVYDAAKYSPGTVSTTLTSLHPPSTSVVMNMPLAGKETIECANLSLWEGQTIPFQVRVGRGTGYEEDLSVVDVTLKGQSYSAEVASGGAAGTDVVTVTTASCDIPDDAFPETVGVATAHFTIVLNPGDLNEEYALVYKESYDSVLDLATFTIAAAWTTDPAVTTTTFTHSHAASEPVELVSDVLTVSPTLRSHFGPSLSPTVQGHPVEFLTAKISLTSAVGFGATGGFLYLNFGNSLISARSRYSAKVSPPLAFPIVYQFDDTSAFPTTNFPYQITLGQGTGSEEFIDVSANNTGLNQLTFVTAPAKIHYSGSAPFGEFSEFVAGDPILIEYQDVDSNDIILSPPQVIGKHTVGEAVTVSGEYSSPRTDGFSYPFLLPPDAFKSVTTMFDLVRAAGIQVTVIPLPE